MPGDSAITVLHSPGSKARRVIASLPHSGMRVPDDVARSFTRRHRSWLRNTDWHLPQVYSFLPALGVTMLEATHSRYVADLNRNPAGRHFGGFFNAVIAERTAHGEAIYEVLPTANEIEQRIASYHAPYHSELADLLAQAAGEGAPVLLLDLHSYLDPGNVDVCLGNAGGATSNAALLASLAAGFAAESFSVSLNTPFPGGYVIRAHARPPAVQAVQIELRYPLYLDCSGIDSAGTPSLRNEVLADLQDRLARALAPVLSVFD